MVGIGNTTPHLLLLSSSGRFAACVRNIQRKFLGLSGAIFVQTYNNSHRTAQENSKRTSKKHGASSVTSLLFLKSIKCPVVDSCDSLPVSHHFSVEVW